MATTITSSQVVADFGAYYIDAGQNENNIHSRLMEDFGSLDSFRIIDSGEDTVIREANTAYTEVLQGFQKQFTPKGGITFTPKEIPLRNMKVDEMFYPDDLKNQWLSFLTSNNLDRTTWPFVRFFIEEYVLKQIKQDLELKAVYTGVYLAPTAGTPNNAVDTIDGVKKQINVATTAGSIVSIVTGAPSADPVTFCTQIENFCAATLELYWSVPMDLNMSRTLRLRYRKGRQTKYNLYYVQAKDLDVVEGFENIQIEGLASMIGANKIWMTPTLNAIVGFKGGTNYNIVQIEKVDRQVKVYTDFWMGFGFIDNGVVFTNDQDLT
jgi:hypothetical protein